MASNKKTLWLIVGVGFILALALTLVLTLSSGQENEDKEGRQTTAQDDKNDRSQKKDDKDGSDTYQEGKKLPTSDDAASIVPGEPFIVNGEYQTFEVTVKTSKLGNILECKVLSTSFTEQGINLITNNKKEFSQNLAEYRDNPHNFLFPPSGDANSYRDPVLRISEVQTHLESLYGPDKSSQIDLDDYLGMINSHRVCYLNLKVVRPEKTTGGGCSLPPSIPEDVSEAGTELHLDGYRNPVQFFNMDMAWRQHQATCAGFFEIPKGYVSFDDIVPFIVPNQQDKTRLVFGVGETKRPSLDIELPRNRPQD